MHVSTSIKYRAMDRHAMGFRKYSFYMKCAPEEHVRWASQSDRFGLGLARSLRVRVSEFPMVGKDFFDADRRIGELTVSAHERAGVQ